MANPLVASAMLHANPRKTALAKWMAKEAPAAGEQEWGGWGGWGGEAEREFTRPRREEWGWGREAEVVVGDREVEVRVEQSPNGEGLYGSGSDLSFEALEELKLLRMGQTALCCLGRGVERGQERSGDGGLAAREEKVAEAWWTTFPEMLEDAPSNEAQPDTNEPKPKRKWCKKVNSVFSKMKKLLVKMGSLKHLHGESARKTTRGYHSPRPR